MEKRNLLFVIFLIGLAAFPPMSTDVYLASMPAIKQFFHVSTVEVQLTLAVFFMGFSLMQLVWGPLSDRFGRKAILYSGLFVYIASSFACVFAPTIAWLITARLFQAIGACSAAVIRYAMIKDRLSSQEAARLLGLITSIMAVAPMIAPVVGTYLFVHFGWESNFYFLAFFGVVILLLALTIPETHHGERASLKPIHLCRQYIKFFSKKEFMLYAVTASLSFSAMFSFIASSSFIYIRHFHIETVYFGYLFALNASSLVISGLSFSRLTGRVPVLRLNLIGLLLIFLGGLGMAVFYVLTGSIFSVIVPMFVATLGVGLAIPSSIALALHNVQEHAGMGSSVVGALQYGSAAFASVLMGLAVHNAPIFLSIMILACGGLALLCYCFNPKENLY